MNRLRLLIFLFIGFTAAGGRAQELRLDVSSRIRYDDDAQGNDYDALFFTNLNITDIIKNRVDLKIAGWGLWDIGSSDAFDRALDRQNIRISEAYIDFRNTGPMTRLRLGRQYLYDVDYLHLDGAMARFNETKRLSFFLFGGKEVSYYQSTSDDWAAGGGVVWKPTWRTRHQLDAYVLHEGGEAFFASAWRWNQDWGRGWRTTSRLRSLDAEIRDYRLFLSKYFESIGLGVDIDYFLQPATRGSHDERRARTLAVFGRILGARTPNHRLAINLSKYFNEAWLGQLGGSIHRRLDNDDTTFNTVESNSAYLSLTHFNTFIKKLDATIAAEFIDNEFDSLWTMTGDLSYRLNKQWEFSLGYSYSRYRLDPIDFQTELNGQDDVDLLIEDLRIPTYFFSARWRPNKTYDIRGDFTWQDTGQIPGNGLSVRLGFNYHLRTSLASKSKSETSEAAETSSEESSKTGHEKAAPPRAGQPGQDQPAGKEAP